MTRTALLALSLLSSIPAAFAAEPVELYTFQLQRFNFNMTAKEHCKEFSYRLNQLKGVHDRKEKVHASCDEDLTTNTIWLQMDLVLKKSSEPSVYSAFSKQDNECRRMEDALANARLIDETDVMGITLFPSCNRQNLHLQVVRRR